MNQDIIDFTIQRLERESVNLSLALGEISKQPYEHLEARFHDKIVNQAKQIVAIAENFEAAMKDKRFAGVKGE